MVRVFMGGYENVAVGLVCARPWPCTRTWMMHRNSAPPTCLPAGEDAPTQHNRVTTKVSFCGDAFSVSFSACVYSFCAFCAFGHTAFVFSLQKLSAISCRLSATHIYPAPQTAPSVKTGMIPHHLVS